METKVTAEQHAVLKKRLDYPHHRQQLVKESGIAPQVILDRGYRTVKIKAELKRLGFGRSQQRAPALVIPMYGPTGELVTHQIKPDSPRKDRDGKPIKYETPAKSRVRLDIHPSQADRLKKPTIPLWITEGVKKADCLVSHGQCTVALQGVWCWQKDGLPLPEGEGGKKQGVDDYLVAGGTVEDMKIRATDGLRDDHGADRYEKAMEDSANSANSANGGSQVTQAPPWEPPAPFHTFDLPAFPTEVLPDWIEDLVEAEANATQTPVDLASMLALGVGALACAKVVEVEPWDGWREPVNLYTATAMPPGSRKSAVFADLMAPVEEFEARSVEDKAPEIEEQQTMAKIYEGRLQKAEK